MLSHCCSTVLPKEGSTEEKVANFIAVGEKEQVAVGLKSQPLHIHIFERTVSLVFFVGLTLNETITTS